MRHSQIELLNYLSGFDEEGATSGDVSENFDITEETANRRLAIVRKEDLSKRIRNSENQYAHIITDKGLKVLEQVGRNPLQGEVKKMENSDRNGYDEVTYTLPSDLADTIEDMAQDENKDIDDLVEEILCAGIDALYEDESESEDR